MLLTSTRVLAAAILLTFGIGGAYAADSLSIVVVDQERVMRDSVAGKDLARQAATLRDQIQGEVTQEQNGILNDEKELQANAKSMSPAQREQKIRTAQVRRQGYQEFEQKKSQVLQMSIGRAQNQISVALRPVLMQIINERKATLLLDRQVVMYSVPGMDVTDEAIKRLDNIIKTVTLVRVEAPGESRPPSAPGKPPLGIVRPN